MSILDQYTNSPRSVAALASRREALLDQLGWLAEEARALEPVLSSLPVWAIDQAPLANARSAKETFALLARLDERVYTRWVEQLVSEVSPVLEEREDPATELANSSSLSELLAGVVRARNSLIDLVQEVPDPEWTRTGMLEAEDVNLFDILLRIVRHDADCLRDLAYRLHEAELSA